MQDCGFPFPRTHSCPKIRETLFLDLSVLCTVPYIESSWEEMKCHILTVCESDQFWGYCSVRHDWVAQGSSLLSSHKNGVLSSFQVVEYSWSKTSSVFHEATQQKSRFGHCSNLKVLTLNPSRLQVSSLLEILEARPCCQSRCFGAALEVEAFGMTEVCSTYPFSGPLKWVSSSEEICVKRFLFSAKSVNLEFLCKKKISIETSTVLHI